MALNISTNGGSAASVKDPAPEPDFVLWEPPEKKEEPTTNQPNATKVRVDAEFYKRVGFYAAFNNTSHQEFRQAIQRLHKTIERNLENLNQELTEDVERFKKRKEEAENKVKEIKVFLVRYEEEVGLLKTELLCLQARLQELREEIRAAVINIGAKKETLIQDRQEALLAELERLNGELENVVRKRMGLNEEIFLKQKEVLQEKRTFWSNLFKRYDAEYARVLAKLELYSIPGFHALSSTFLYNAGLISATVAGAFFGSFAEANSLTSGGLLSFILQGIFRFSTGFVGQSNTSDFGKRLINAGVLLVIFIVLLALIFAVSWACHFAYQRLIQGKPSEKKKQQEDGAHEADTTGNSFAIKLETSDELPVTTKMSENNVLGFWLRIIPFLLFLAIAFVFVSLGTDLADVKGLGSSPAEYGTGFLIAVASGGIAYLYLTMFLERRIEQQIEETNKVSWTKLNLELVGVILAFMMIILLTLLVFQHPFKAGTSTLSIVSFIFFAGSCLLTAFTLGFGIRLQSLEMSRRELEMNCNIIQTRLIWISRPFQIYLTRRENVQFNRRFIQIRDEVMSLMLERTMLTRRAAKTPLVTVREKLRFLSNVNRWLRKRLPWRSNADTEKKDVAPEPNLQSEPDGLSASEDVKLCFPKLEAELSAVESEAGEVKRRIATVEREIEYRTEQKGEFCEKKLAELKQQEIRAQNYHKAIANRQKKHHYDVDQEHLRERFFTQKIVEGYELGDWFRSHGQANTVVPDFSLNGNGNKP